MEKFQISFDNSSIYCIFAENLKQSNGYIIKVT